MPTQIVQAFFSALAVSLLALLLLRLMVLAWAQRTRALAPFQDSGHALPLRHSARIRAEHRRKPG